MDILICQYDIPLSGEERPDYNLQSNPRVHETRLTSLKLKHRAGRTEVYCCCAESWAQFHLNTSRGDPSGIVITHKGREIRSKEEVFPSLQHVQLSFLLESFYVLEVKHSEHFSWLNILFTKRNATSISRLFMFKVFLLGKRVHVWWKATVFLKGFNPCKDKKAFSQKRLSIQSR